MVEDIGFEADKRPAFNQGDRVMVYSGNQPIGVGTVTDVYSVDGRFRYGVDYNGTSDAYLASELATYGGE